MLIPPIRPLAQAPRAATAPGGPTPQPAPEPPPPPAAAPPLYSAEYGAAVYARRLRTVLALQAELAAALSASRSGGRS